MFISRSLLCLKAGLWTVSGAFDGLVEVGPSSWEWCVLVCNGAFYSKNPVRKLLCALVLWDWDYIFCQILNDNTLVGKRTTSLIHLLAKWEFRGEKKGAYLVTVQPQRPLNRFLNRDMAPYSSISLFSSRLRAWLILRTLSLSAASLIWSLTSRICRTNPFASDCPAKNSVRIAVNAPCNCMTSWYVFRHFSTARTYRPSHRSALFSASCKSQRICWRVWMASLSSNARERQSILQCLLGGLLWVRHIPPISCEIVMTYLDCVAIALALMSTRSQACWNLRATSSECLWASLHASAARIEPSERRFMKVWTSWSGSWLVKM